MSAAPRRRRMSPRPSSRRSIAPTCDGWSPAMKIDHEEKRPATKSEKQIWEAQMHIKKTTTIAPMTIIGRPDLPPNTLAELVTYIKANGDKMTFGNAGLGAASHLCGMLFMTAVGKEILAVPYKGNAPIMNDLIGKQIDLSCDQTTNTTAPIASKLIKSYAITTKTRLGSMPDLPTADEAGLKGFEVGAWHGIYAPKGTPDEIVQKLSRTLQEALRDPDLVKRFNEINTEPVPQNEATPEALKTKLISEVDRWAPIIKAAGQFAD